jgi:Transmembrane protein 138
MDGLVDGWRAQSLLYSGKVDRLTAWDHDAFYGLFVIHKMVAPAYYLALLHAVVKLGQPHWYNKAVWVQRFTSV